MQQEWKNLDADERCAAIIAIYPKTKGTGKEIAHALSQQFRVTISRNAVISHYNRHAPKLVDVPLTGTPNRYLKPKSEISAPKQQTKPAAAPSPKPKKPSSLLLRSGGHFAQPVIVKPLAKPPVLEQPLTAPEPKYLELYLLKSNECRWPVEGDRENTLFCGAATDQQESYCPCHRKMSIGIGSRAERDALRRRKTA
ncbi:GcrA cell cycle regulator [compost metagenome]